MVTNPGVYNLQFSGQLVIATAGTEDAIIWFRKNGLDIPRTGTTITMQNRNVYVVAAWNFVDSLNANDYLEIVMWSDGVDLQLRAEPGRVGPPVTIPSIPSVIATLTQVA